MQDLAGISMLKVPQVGYRITSYNVCYTKLLRLETGRIEVNVGQAGENRLSCKTVNGLVNDAYLSSFHCHERKALYCVSKKILQACNFFRITSYNVCYTKLLRVLMSLRP